MFCDEIKTLDPYGWNGMSPDGLGLIAMYMDNLPNIHKFFLTEDFIDFSAVEEWNKYPQYVEKIKPLVKLPYFPTLLEYSQKKYRNVSIFDKLGDNIVACSFNEIPYEGHKAVQASIIQFNPDSMQAKEDGSFFYSAGYLFNTFTPHEDCIGQAAQVTLKWMDIFARLNSPAITDITPQTDMTRLNKKRARNNKSPLSSYHVVSLTQPIKKAMKQRENKGESYKVRLHWVRGHFKVCRTGIFWWNPHTAGRKELGEVKKDYIKDVA